MKELMLLMILTLFTSVVGILTYIYFENDDIDWGNCPSSEREIAETTGTHPGLWKIRKNGPTVEYTYLKQGGDTEILHFPANVGYIGVIMGHGYTSAYTQFTNNPRSSEETLPEVTGPFTWVCISR